MKHTLLIIVAVMILSFPVKSITPTLWLRSDTLSLCIDTAISYSEKYTVIAVVRDTQAATFHPLWCTIINDTIKYSVLNNGIYRNDIGIINFNSTPNFNQWSIYTYYAVNIKNSDSILHLCIGSNPTYKYFTDSILSSLFPNSVIIKEYLYFPNKLKQTEEAIWQSYLAMKYGVTLNKAPYLDFEGDTLWSPIFDADYYYKIVGIGNDTLHNWETKHSQSLEHSSIALQTDSCLDIGEYILAGENEYINHWISKTELQQISAKSVRLKAKLKSQHITTLIWTIPKFMVIADSIQLIVCDTNNNVVTKVLSDSILNDSVLYFTFVTKGKVYDLHLESQNISTINKEKKQSDDENEIQIIYDKYNNAIIINGQTDNYHYYLYDSSGKLLKYYSRIIESNINVNDLPCGTYIFSIRDDFGEIIRSISFIK